MARENLRDRVGPVLQAGSVANAIIAAIRDQNKDVLLVDRGAYIRVQATSPCRVSCQAIESHLGRPFLLPQDLEAVMSSFKGRLFLRKNEIVWEFSS